MSMARIIVSALLAGLVARPAPAVWHAIIDNDAGAPGYVETGSGWTTSTATGYDGGTYRWVSVGTSATATWTAELPAAGDYDVLVWYRESYNRATATHYDVFAADGTHTVVIDQQTDGQRWRSLGIFPFDAGSRSVRLDAAASTGGTVVIADAVRFRDTSCDCLPDEFDTIALQATDIFHAIDDARDENAYAGSTDAGVLAWSDSSITMAYLAMYEATRDPEYLDVVKTHAELIFPHRGDRIGMLD
ncbi:MAG: hypothetical protein JXA69_07075, partial [Phycisphaerae bacterium]|nr:hypothetical protein [Phycisphaerae bacterium]